MNPFASLIDPGAAISTAGLADSLRKPRELAEQDDEPLTELAYEVVSRRTYRPKGLTLQVLLLLQDRRPWTYAEIGEALGRSSGEINSLLGVPVRHGIVRRINSTPAMWVLV